MPKLNKIKITLITLRETDIPILLKKIRRVEPSLTTSLTLFSSCSTWACNWFLLLRWFSNEATSLRTMSMSFWLRFRESGSDFFGYGSDRKARWKEFNKRKQFNERGCMACFLSNNVIWETEDGKIGHCYLYVAVSCLGLEKLLFSEMGKCGVFFESSWVRLRRSCFAFFWGSRLHVGVKQGVTKRITKGKGTRKIRKKMPKNENSS